MAAEVEIINCCYNANCVGQDMQLLSESRANIIDSDYLYVYDTSLPYPDAKNMSGQSSETKMDLYSDRWLYARDEVATIKTRTLAVQGWCF